MPEHAGADGGHGGPALAAGKQPGQAPRSNMCLGASEARAPRWLFHAVEGLAPGQATNVDGGVGGWHVCK